MSTPHQPADGSGPDDGAQQPAPDQSSGSQQPPVAPPVYGQQPPVAPPIYGQQPPVAPPIYGQQPPADPYGQPQPPADPYGQPAPYAQQPWAPTSGYPSDPASAYAGGVLPKEAYASWGQRVGAFLLDYVLTLPFIIVGSILIGVGAASTASKLVYDPTTNTYSSTGGGVSALAVVGYLIYVLGVLAVDIWNRWYTAGKTGQSWGKRVMGIKLVRASDGQPIGPGMAFVRDLAHIVDGLICYVGYLFPLWDAKRQTLSDKIVSTVVYPGAPKSSKLF